MREDDVLSLMVLRLTGLGLPIIVWPRGLGLCQFFQFHEHDNENNLTLAAEGDNENILTLAEEDEVYEPCGFWKGRPKDSFPSCQLSHSPGETYGFGSAGGP